MTAIADGPVNPGDLSVQMDTLLSYLAEAHGAQLAAANLEAAKWRAAAAGAAAELSELRRQVVELRRPDPEPSESLHEAE